MALPPDLLGACGRVETITRRAFSYGFDPRATRIAEGIIAGVDPAGPAHAAGMRNGMTLVLRETGVIGDSSQTLSYRVKDGGEEKIIAYLPEGQAVHQVQRIALAGDDADASACTARLGGGGGVQ
jgi:predicted metalloprotease with PDZ domain